MTARSACSRPIKLINTYVMSLGESLSSGPFFKAYVVNLFPGQFVQPFVDAAFSDLGLDPATLLPSQLTDPQTGQPGTPALPVPYPRTGQGGEPRSASARRDHRQTRAIRAYPYREPPAPPTAWRPAAGAACAAATRVGLHAGAEPVAGLRAGTGRGAARPATGRTTVMKRPRTARAVLATALVLVLCAGLFVAVRMPAQVARTTVVGLLREQHRGVRRRPRAHPRRAGRQDRSDRTAARAGQDHDLVRQQVQGPRRCQGRDPGTAAGDRPDNPAHTCPTPADRRWPTAR